MIPSVEQLCQEQSEWEQYVRQMAAAQSLSGLVWMALPMGLFIARQLVQQEFGRRAAQPAEWGNCVQCGTRLHAKGWQARSVQTLVGKID